MAKSDEPFHRPFSKLKGIAIKKERKEKKPPPAQTPAKKKTPANNTELFLHAMEGVRPIESDCIVPEPVDAGSIVESIRETIRHQDTEVVQTLQALVDGKARFDVTCTGEYLEGHVVTLDPAVLKKLKAGEMSIQAHLDLHGHIISEAQSALSSFLSNAHAMGYRGLLVIHGRGLTSSQGPVLKEHVVRWLTRGSLSHLVLAFCSARPCDGGTGALYVLLRKRPRKSKWNRPL